MKQLMTVIPLRSISAGLCVATLMLASCRPARVVPSSATAKRSAEKSRTAVVTESSKSKPEIARRSASSEKTGYPATEYYGNSWDTEYLRLSSSQAPVGTVRLTINGAFVVPVCGRINSEFGPRNGAMHTGIDIKVEPDAPVYCAFDGMVRMAKNYGDYGNIVTVRHENGLETVYAHLNSIAVNVNQRLKAGDRVGGGGRTGRASGVHLHFETRFKGEPFNPRLLIDFENCRLQSTTLALNEYSYRKYGKNLQTGVPVKKETSTSAILPVLHVVQKGDTLYSLARRYETTVEQLRKLNRLTEQSTIQTGQQLRVK
ncbi:MAG: peptidoglycan DD-metalloendopeptidase family protein [Bacteroidales bacterium]|jgi:murein DD-endopeptidase MepM/ murein hydrolase activator NlpD|nr:peptidoglycan DD-metalloendopeptidase family protein [Bacteroidales bacterium]